MRLNKNKRLNKHHVFLYLIFKEQNDKKKKNENEKDF